MIPKPANISDCSVGKFLFKVDEYLYLLDFLKKSRFFV